MMLSVSNFCQIIGGKLLYNGNCEEISAVNIYPVELFTYDTFFAINSSKYSTTDGSFGNTGNEDSTFGLKGIQNTHSYINTAIIHGATTIIFDETDQIRSFHEKVNYILVEDSLTALALYAKHIISQSGTKIIGITGSTGKTTLTHAIKRFLGRDYIISSPNYIRITYIGLIWHIIHELPPECEWLIIEMQTDGPGQLDRLCHIIQFDYAFIVNVNNAHLQRFSTQDNILHEKLAVYRGLKNNGKLFISADCDILRDWYIHHPDHRIFSVGMLSSADVCCSLQSNTDKHMLCVTDRKSSECSISFQLSAKRKQDIAVAYFLCAFAMKADFPVQNIGSLIDAGFSIPGRFQIFKGINDATVIVDSYNASQISTSYGIEYLSAHRKSKKILVLGSLLELAQTSENTHRHLGKLIKELGNISVVLCLGEATLYVLDELVETPILCKHTYSYEHAVSFLKELKIDKDTVIYIKGSGAMRMEIIALHLLSENTKE